MNHYEPLLIPLLMALFTHKKKLKKLGFVTNPFSNGRRWDEPDSLLKARYVIPVIST